MLFYLENKVQICTICTVLGGARLQTDEDKKPLTVDLNHSFHPYTDKTLTETQPDSPILLHNEPFNDGIKHGDIVAGHHQNRTLSDYPRKARPWIRIYAIASLLLFVAGVIWDFVVR